MLEAIDFVRRRPELFFPNGKFSPELLTSKLVSQGYFFGANRIQCNRYEGMYSVNFDKNWLSELDEPLDVFSKIISDERLGLNSNYSEILLSSYCRFFLAIKSEGEIINQQGRSDIGLELNSILDDVIHDLEGWELTYIFME